MSEIKNFGINLNFDSLGEAYGWPSGFKEDKAFTKGLDRITSLCRKLNIPITIFVRPHFICRKNSKMVFIIDDMLYYLILPEIPIHVIWRFYIHEF